MYSLSVCLGAVTFLTMQNNPEVFLSTDETTDLESSLIDLFNQFAPCDNIIVILIDTMCQHHYLNIIIIYSSNNKGDNADSITVIIVTIECNLTTQTKCEPLELQLSLVSLLFPL